MRKEAQIWLRQAEADLKAAKDSIKDGNYEWCCFQSQQCAEKSLKAFLYNLGYTTIVTHSVKNLVKEAGKKEKSFLELVDAGRVLDAYYIPTRYPNGLDEDMAPVDYYDKEDAKKCLECAISILNIVRKYLKG